jgi:hypothetical protein
VSRRCDGFADRLAVSGDRGSQLEPPEIVLDGELVCDAP